MNATNTYELNIYASDNRTFRIVGPRITLEQAHSEWADSTFDDNSKLTVIGYSDDARSVPTLLTLSRSIIEGMRLEKL